MGFDLRKRTARPPAMPAVALRIGVLGAMALVALGALAAPASAAWNNTGAGGGASKARAMPAGNTPTTSVSGRNVTVSWTASSFSGGGPNVSDYTVKRYNTSGVQQSIGAGCSGTITALTCTEANVPSGSWKYSVTPRVGGNWVGTESSQSAPQTVASPSYTLSSPSAVTSLPAALSGALAAFQTGATVTYRLDNQSTGTVLSATTTPSTIGNAGSATNSVTIPSGTANGSHTIYAIGSSGDVASVAITVNVPQGVLGSAWDVTDASTGAASDTSSVAAFANDGRTGSSGNFTSAFSTTRYAQFDYYPALPSGLAVSGLNFNFRFAATRSGDTACYYFDVRRASTGAVLATHGSAAAPVACNTGLTFTTANTALSEITSSNDANDLRVRIYLRNSGGRPVTTDMATVTGTYSDGIFSNTPFTLYDSIDTDASSGVAQTFPWGLAYSGDTGATAAYTTGSWASAFSSTRYLEFTFPANVPSGAVITQASLDHAYRSFTSGTTCYYFQVFSGATLLGTHGSAASPQDCNSSTTTLASNNISLPEVTTAGQANGLIVKMFVRNSAATASLHDHLRLNLKYAQ